ncbi:MAG: tetratricopeptide repeat protein [Planctomycetota bacterium]|nr:MAG: tetratricopeptide repeat protein [Planctomycetota bacterium]REJ89415.1 MAG: tetratricopeptide repeat protein [Planctomycetota bacterium]REK26213.1 MAG: tetratricopeptide repeat protein [Planctomycetota bacterium]REK44545.1 MAG: tetratricopeptide repeat protein [Planctomycetota bacterium]
MRRLSLFAVLLPAVLLLLVATPPQALADNHLGDEQANPIGQHDLVIVVVEQAPVRRGEQLVANVRAGMMLEVLDVQGDSFRVAGTRQDYRAPTPPPGLIAADAVMRPSDAVAFLGQQVEKNPGNGFWMEARANARRHAGELAQSVTDYDQLTRQFPNRADYINARGRAWEDFAMLNDDIRSLASAAADYQRALVLDPQLADAYANLGALERSRNRFDAALVHLNDAIKLQPESPVALLNRAAVYSNMGQHGKSLADCNAAIQLDPLYPDGYEYRGFAYQGLGNLQQGFDDFGKAIEIDPTNSMRYALRGYVYREHKDYENAIADFTAGLKAYDRSIRLLSLRAGTYFTIQRFDEAIADYRRIIEIDPASTPARRYLADTLDAANRADEAMKVRDAIIQRNTKDPEGYVIRGVAWFNRQEFGKAYADFNAAVQLAPRYRNALVYRAVAAAEMKNYALAVEGFTAAIQAYPQDGMLYNDRGVNHRRLGNYEAAMTDFNKAIQLNPKIVSAHTHIGMISAAAADVKFRDNERALEYAQRALELSGFENFFCLDALAAAHAAAGDFELAVKTAERALAGIERTRQETQVTEQDQADVEARLALYREGKPYVESPPPANGEGESDRDGAQPDAAAADEEEEDVPAAPEP